MNEVFIRQTKIEDAYEDMHGIKPEVSYLRQDPNCYHVKLKFKNKEVIITEILDRGLTKKVTLEYEGKTEDFKHVYDAELRANDLMKGKKWQL